MSCSNDIDKAAKNPNMGMELSNSEKAKLGGSTSGTIHLAGQLPRNGLAIMTGTKEI
ncbi:hypothetical protein AB6G29_17765 [Providencia hangzhouensis]|uniref:hypothetical protein n=1 Tax=Providencia hangzhouensis TaxID=3031799 RepID=UPI0034DD33D8